MEKAKLLMTCPDSPPVGSWAHGVGRAVGLLAQPWKVGTPMPPGTTQGIHNPSACPSVGHPFLKVKTGLITVTPNQ